MLETHPTPIPPARNIDLSSPDAPLLLYRQLKQNALTGKDMDPNAFLQTLSDLDRATNIKKQPILLKKLLMAGQDPRLQEAIKHNLTAAIAANDKQAIKECHRQAHYLGIEKTLSKEKSLKNTKIIDEAVTQMMAREHISEDEAYERIHRGQPLPLPQRGDVQNPGRRALLGKAAALAGAATLTAIGINTLTGETQSTAAPSLVPERPIVPEQPVNLFSELMKPFIDEAMKRRAERARNDPEYSHRVDRELNAERINFVVFIEGENYEPPNFPQPAGTYQIISMNLKTNTIDLVSITHDTRAPEIERYLQNQNKRALPTRIDRAYEIGKFDLMRQILENATGFSADFQIAGSDIVVKDMVDQVFGGLIVDVPWDIKLHEIYLKGEKQSKWSFAKGKQRMDGLNILRFIKAEHDSDIYDPKTENHPRKHLVFNAFFESLKENLRNPLFLGKTLLFLRGISQNGAANSDFDLTNLVINNLSQFSGAAFRGISQKIEVPQVAKRIFIVDSAIGDGGVQWAIANKVDNPVTQKDWDNGVYPDEHMEVPINANPYSADPVKDYWQSVRALVKNKLLGE